MSRRLPFAVEVDIVRTRQMHSIKETADIHEVSERTVLNVLERNAELVAQMEQAVIADAIASPRVIGSGRGMERKEETDV